MTYSSDSPQGPGQPREEPYGRPGERPSDAGNPYATMQNMLSNTTWQVLVTAGLVAIALGIMVLAWPGPSLVVIGVLFGAYLLISGIFQLAGAFGSHIPRQLRVLSFITGALSVMLGLLCFRGPAQSILLLALWIGFAWLIRGVMMTAMAISGEGMPARGWQVFLGALTILGGIILIVAPFGSITALTVVAGIWLLALGIIEIMHGIQLRASLGGPGAPRAEHRGMHFPRFRSQPHPQA
ncbi:MULTISPECIES: HdeD family acid-resistance protein [Streptomyces]|uniref:HdeD family acid-resistance protein n=1 Tax=Streptomyces rhizosphaericus TaxID=114699 RepID=A0A6G4AJG8_9ACTN|nr:MULTISPECIES: HdeD family acid-resistance protein [Streptomyces]MBA6441844.1 HdeD family acid-resistance protein [Streptomyces sp. GMR22]NEW73586.1 HdeD family acid-resistance protein [Streptomyces rhizosphaericus]